MATPKQMRKLIELFEDIPTQQIQKVIPFLTILRDANVSRIDRGEFRKICGLKSKWTVDPDGVIRFSVTGLGLSGPEMEKYLVAEGHENSDHAKRILNSPDYVPCEVDKVYNLAALPGKLFSDNERTTENIRKEGDRRGLIHGKNLPTEIGALLRLNFTNKEIEEMGLNWLVAMHEPVKDSAGSPSFLGTYRDDVKSWLYASWVKPGNLWLRENGFVFGAPQD